MSLMTCHASSGPTGADAFFFLPLLLVLSTDLALSSADGESEIFRVFDPRGSEVALDDLHVAVLFRSGLASKCSVGPNGNLTDIKQAIQSIK